MFKRVSFFLNILPYFLIASSLCYAQTNEQITLTTYYPSPQGSYVELRARRLVLGDNYLSPTAFCWPPTACANVIDGNADLVVEGTVGIGTINPGLAKVNIVGRLQIDSGAVMGRQGFGIGSGGFDMEDFWYDGGSDSTYFFRHIAPVGPNSRLILGTGVPGAAFTPIMGVYNNGNVIISPNALATLPTDRLVVEGGLKLSGTQEGAYQGIYMSNGDITVDGGTDGVFGFQHSGNGASTINFGTPYWPPNTWTMTINTTTGRVGIGTQTPAYQLELSLDSAAKPTSNTWTVPSDRRVKKDIEPFNDGLDVINQINPVRYKLNGKAGLPLNKEGISVIAQDIKDVAPYTIKTWKAKLDPTDTEKTELYDFDSSPLTFVIINAIKEQQRKIERLEAEIVELKSRLRSND